MNEKYVTNTEYYEGLLERLLWIKVNLEYLNKRQEEVIHKLQKIEEEYKARTGVLM